MAASFPAPRDPVRAPDHPLARASASFSEAAGSLERTYGQLQGQVAHLPGNWKAPIATWRRAWKRTIACANVCAAFWKVADQARHFAALYGKPGTQPRLSPALLARLEEHTWPGNVRELANFVRRAVALSRGGEIGVEAFDHGKISTGAAVRLPEWKPGLSLGEMERRLFSMTLEATKGNRARAAELLGVSLRTVRNKVREFGLPPRSNYVHD